MIPAILAVDQGTTNSKALLASTGGEIIARGTAPVGIGHPHPGWVEQDPLQIWASVQAATALCLASGRQSTSWASRFPTSANRSPSGMPEPANPWGR